MMQGDAYGLLIEILDAEGGIVSPAVVSNVEITVGPIKKTYASGEVSFNTAEGKWVFPLTQEESFRFPAARVKAQVRVVWQNGDVEGASLGCIVVGESTSREVL